MLGRRGRTVEKIMTWRAFLQALLMIQKPTTCDDARAVGVDSRARGVALAIVRVALPVAAHRLFDYWLPAGLVVGRGSVLVVKLGARSLPGVAVELADTSEVGPDRLLPIDQIVAGIPPLPDDLIDLASFIAAYYQQPIGLCLAQMLPPLVAAPATRAPLSARYRMTAAGAHRIDRRTGPRIDDARVAGVRAWRIDRRDPLVGRARLAPVRRVAARRLGRADRGGGNRIAWRAYGSMPISAPLWSLRYPSEEAFGLRCCRA